MASMKTEIENLKRELREKDEELTKIFIAYGDIMDAACDAVKYPSKEAFEYLRETYERLCR